MAIRRMNEMWRRLALHVVLSVLLLQGCQGQESTTVQHSQGTLAQSSDPTVTTFRSTTISTITMNVSQTSTASGANTTLSTAMRASTDTMDANITLPATADKTNDTGYEKYNFTIQLNKRLPATHFNSDVTKKPDQSTISLQSETNKVQSEVLQSEANKAQSEADSVQTSSNDKENKTSSSVFVPVLLTGLALGAVLIGVYVWKNHCHAKGNSMKLAEESDHADEENQGNTLVSVAPLNPPEDQEKPNQNGESLEAVKIQNSPAATNGHSATKADTEF